jgi:hypothetical protein
MDLVRPTLGHAGDPPAISLIHFLNAPTYTSASTQGRRALRVGNVK